MSLRADRLIDDHKDPTVIEESLERGQATSAAVRPDRRARQLERRRSQVYEAALALFMERGFEETTMDDIAERADVARTSVFNYFSPKTAFLFEWGTRRRDMAQDALRSATSEDRSAPEVLRRYLDVLGELNANAREECVVMMGASLKFTEMMDGQRLAPELTAIIQRGQAKGEIRADVDPEQVGLLLSVGYFATLATWIAVEPEPFDVRTQLAKLSELILHGLL